MKNRTRSLVATAVVALVAFGGVTAASAFGPGGETPVDQQPHPANTRANGTSIPVQREFVAVAPCRIADTRAASAGKLQPGQPRLITVAGTSAFPAQGGHAGGCGVPSNAAAAVVSLTSTQAAGAGYLRAWAFGGSEPTATVLNWTKLGGGGITTGATVPINGGMDIKGFGKATDVVIDVTGYYVDPIAAVISSGGNLGSHSSTVTSASRDSIGAYTVNFSQNIEGCAIQVTAETSFYSAGSEIIGNHAAIYLRNVTAAGAYGDTNFSLTVTC